MIFVVVFNNWKNQPPHTPTLPLGGQAPPNKLLQWKRPLGVLIRCLKLYTHTTMLVGYIPNFFQIQCSGDEIFGNDLIVFYGPSTMFLLFCWCLTKLNGVLFKYLYLTSISKGWSVYKKKSVWGWDCVSQLLHWKSFRINDVPILIDEGKLTILFLHARKNPYLLKSSHPE